MSKSLLLILVCLAACLLGGCAESIATIETVHPPLGHRKVETREAAYQFSPGRVVEIVFARQWAKPAGDATPDYEYVHIVVPDSAGSYRVGGDDRVQLTRLVRTGREMFLYEATAGSIDYRFALLTGDHVHADFDVTTRQVWPRTAAESAHALTGKARAAEDIRTAQGLINRYAETVEALREKAAGRDAAPQD